MSFNTDRLRKKKKAKPHGAESKRNASVSFATSAFVAPARAQRAADERPSGGARWARLRREEGLSEDGAEAQWGAPPAATPPYRGPPEPEPEPEPEQPDAARGTLPSRRRTASTVPPRSGALSGGTAALLAAGQLTAADGTARSRRSTVTALPEPPPTAPSDTEDEWEAVESVAQTAAASARQRRRRAAAPTARGFTALVQL